LYDPNRHVANQKQRYYTNQEMKTYNKRHLGLLGTPVQFQFLINKSHGSCFNEFRGQYNLLNSKLNVRMGKKGDLSNFERGMVVGGFARRFARAH